MGNVGRYFCVALPFVLTVAAIIAGLVAGLAGVTDNHLHLFEINLKNLSVDATQIESLIGDVGDLFSRDAQPVEWHDRSFLDEAEDTWDDLKDTAKDVSDKASDASDIVGDLSGQDGDTRIYASTLGLANVYDFTIWGFCTTPQDGKRNCTKAEFDWATKYLNESGVDDIVSQLPGLNDSDSTVKSLKDGLNTYKTVNKWTEVVYIIAMVALGLELVVGLFTACSQAMSCLTWVVSGFATVAIIAAAIMMTVMASVVVGAVEGAGKEFGVKATVSTDFLSAIWISVAFAVGAGLFWLLSICCCKPESRPAYKRGRRGSDSEKFLSGSYAPIGGASGENRNTAYGGYGGYAPQPRLGGGRSDMAYEPYTRNHV
ncbi:SUR7 protein [Xylariomycetidae sp. FL0641]|nr:SUR7 protein [Xylariomycetidae sp. FL0641]